MVHLDIENPGGRVLAVKGVPSHRQRIPSGGTPNLPTATANADLAQGEGEAGFSGAVVAHGGRPKKTHRSRAHHRASQPAGSADYTFQQSTIRRDKLRDLYHGLFLDKPWPECVGSERRGGSDEPYETGGDGEERPTILPGPAIVVKSAKGCCPHILSGLQAEICREEASPQNQFRAYDVDGRSATRERITEGLCTQHFNSESKSIEKDEGAGTLGVATEPAETLSRPMELTVLGEGSTECLREIPNEKRISVSSPQLNELRTERPSEQRDQADHPPSPEDSVGRDHKALPLPTRDRAGTGTKVSASTPEASYSLPRKDAQISRTQPPSLGFKPKKLRGKFDKRVIEGHLGIELSLERAQKLRIISGNAMSAAISLYLQGYCNVSEGQNPDACEAKDQCPELARHGGNRESGPSTATSQKKRPSENQLEIYPHESADGRASTVSTPSEDASINKPPTEEHAKGVCEEMALLLARTDEAENAKESHLPQDTSRPLVQHEMSREQAVLGRVEWQGDHEESSKNSSRGDFQATDADSNSTFSFDGIKHTNSGMTEANDEGAIPGAGPVPLRGMQGFTNQENVRPRNPPSNTSRLPNGKLGSGSGWGGFGVPMGVAPGLQNMQQRNMTGNGGMGSFAQNIGSSQPATPLDPSEFPSLSGAPQTQQQNPGQAIWAQRPTQQNPTQNQRQQQSQPSQQNSLQSQQQSQSSHDDMFSAASHFSTGLGDYGQGNQPQTGSIDEFPPLGREGSTVLGQERRGSLMQNNAFGGYGASMAFAGMTQQQRNPLSNALDRERMASPATSGMGLISSARSPNSQGPNGNLGQEKLGTIGSGADTSNRQGDFSGQSQQQHPHQSSQMMNNAFGGNDIVDSPSSLQQARPQPLEQMSEADKFGLPGLLAMMHHPSADLRSLTAQGQDLTQLGLDLTSTEPLHTQLASVFNPSAHARLPLDADYTIPACYRVANVQPLHERIPSFSEETLFYIFYSSPKDLVQELVADELIGRKWRFHKGEKMWVTRDENYPAPVEVEQGISEQGFYIWWDWKGWKKVRRQYILRYEDLDNGATRNGSGLNQMALSAAPSAMAQAAGVFTR